MNSRHGHTLSEFGCVRFRDTAFSKFSNEVGKTGCMLVDGTLQPSAFWAGEQTADRYLRVCVDNFGEPLDSIYVVLAKALCQKTVLHAAFLSTGQQVFQFSTALVEAFKRTDLSGTPIGHLRLPYAAGFLHFGRQQDLAINDVTREGAEYVDGAYFHCGPQGQLTVQLTLSRAPGEASEIPSAHYSVTTAMLAMDAHQAIQLTLDAELKKFDSNTESDKALRSAISAWNDDNKVVVHASLSLILNALFYLDAYGATTAEVVPDGVPPDMRDALQRGLSATKPKAVREAKNKLLAGGFTAVRLCGYTAEKAGDHETSDKLACSDVRLHWRRGHWRMQPCGPQLSQVKRIWIRPSLVGKSEVGEVTGHLYQVQT